MRASILIRSRGLPRRATEKGEFFCVALEGMRSQRSLRRPGRVRVGRAGQIATARRLKYPTLRQQARYRYASNAPEMLYH